MVGCLAHHGIRGQRWGTRNGPPYPLKGGSYTKTEWKALKEARKTTMAEVAKSKLTTTGRYALGIYDR